MPPPARRAGKTGGGVLAIDARSASTSSARRDEAAARSVDRVSRPSAALLARRLFGELVADTMDREDIARPVWVRFELSTQILDVCVDGAIERIGFEAADGIEELRASEYA